jgi:eight-cysteine-cluster-containing protein
LKGGCSGQVCQSVKEPPVITTCEWRDCYDPAPFGLQCGCVNGACRWR